MHGTRSLWGRSHLHIPLLLSLAWVAVACGDRPQPAEADRPDGVQVRWGDDNADAERDRHDPTWRQFVTLDSATFTDPVLNPEGLGEISPERVNDQPMYLPLTGDIAGPSVLKLQILLDRALFSPGEIDGRWGMNTEKAVYWLQHREGIPATGAVDSVTYKRLVELAGRPAQLVRRHRLSADEVAGPFIELPDDIYERAELECLCYESLPEKLGEMFHASPGLLALLNPEIELERLSEGEEIWVPNVRPADAGRDAEVARIVVSDGGRYLHALDANERILFHFPSTLGAEYDPSPRGDFRIVSVTKNPWWHYQPDILEHVDDEDEDALIPPGPNNAVGLIWMALSEPHYGIHGTSNPGSIGYASSAGCVRLTNWDALFLGDRVEDDTPVSFRDT
jgi:lipoprotein-anchoring transpeptidase ErfK/SrfK